MYIEMTYQKMSISGGGHGNSLQYSCLKNLMDRGAWRATVHGVARVGHNSGRTVPCAGLGGDGDKGLACPLGKGVRDSGLADRRHSHLTFRFWADI